MIAEPGSRHALAVDETFGNITDWGGDLLCQIRSGNFDHLPKVVTKYAAPEIRDAVLEEVEEAAKELMKSARDLRDMWERYSRLSGNDKAELKDMAVEWFEL